MRYITEMGFTSRFFQAKLAYQLVYHKNSGTLPLRPQQLISWQKPKKQSTLVYMVGQNLPWLSLIKKSGQAFLNLTL